MRADGAERETQDKTQKGKQGGADGKTLGRLVGRKRNHRCRDRLVHHRERQRLARRFLAGLTSTLAKKKHSKSSVLVHARHSSYTSDLSGSCLRGRSALVIELLHAPQQVHWDVAPGIFHTLAIRCRDPERLEYVAPLILEIHCRTLAELREVEFLDVGPLASSTALYAINERGAFIHGPWVVGLLLLPTLSSACVGGGPPAVPCLLPWSRFRGSACCTATLAHAARYWRSKGIVSGIRTLSVVASETCTHRTE